MKPPLELTQDSEARIVFVTCPSEADADNVASTLVESHLAACVSVHAIRSTYSWKDKLERDNEWQLTIKTAASCLPALAEKLRALHPYDVPELLVITVDQGSKAYLAWLADSTYKRLASRPL